jgi:hypothetical protein
MYKNVYQYGRQVHLFNIQDKDTHKAWAFNGHVKKAYDKAVRGYTLLLDHSSKCSIPVDAR